MRTALDVFLGIEILSFARYRKTRRNPLMLLPTATICRMIATKHSKSSQNQRARRVCNGVYSPCGQKGEPCL